MIKIPKEICGQLEFMYSQMMLMGIGKNKLVRACKEYNENRGMRGNLLYKTFKLV